MSDAVKAAPRFTVYMIPTCPHCKATCEFLRGRGVAFEQLDVATDREALTRLIWVTGQATVPAVVVGDEVLIGFDETRLQELIETANMRTPPAEPPD